MATNYGYGRGDVNNSISMASAYPGGRSMGLTAPSSTRYRMRNNSSGEAGSINQSPAYPRRDTTAPNPQGDLPPISNGLMGKPSSWWITFALVFVAFIWIGKQYGSADTKFSNVKLSVYNGIFLTIWIVLILNLLKVAAAKIRVPGLSEMILAA